MTDKIHMPYEDEFADYLKNVDGLAVKTVKRHVANAVDFVYYMSTHGYEVDPDCDAEELPMDDSLLIRGGEFLGMYFSYFLPRKAFATPDSLRQSAGSVKKLYKFLLYKGVVTDEGCSEILDEIKEDTQFWMEECDW